MNALTRTGLDLTEALSAIAQQQKPRVHVCARRYFTSDLTGKPDRSYTVLVEGETYEVDEADYRRLMEGWSPEDLDLMPVEEDE